MRQVEKIIADDNCAQISQINADYSVKHRVLSGKKLSTQISQILSERWIGKVGTRMKRIRRVSADCSVKPRVLSGEKPSTQISQKGGLEDWNGDEADEADSADKRGLLCETPCTQW